ncbi:hypothetical protein [Variovorax soli]|uniref:Uncharacterized protein n=1 Tax=Variovorax soli TaxID=376815 RepID=A0ABU1NHX9_9BURK|nr:hypothetical protein [Variovorax soli]MDR6538074.1 hypothetical protein [Variovorax soli]
MDLHHPLFQSLALPLVVAFMVTGMLRGALGPVQGRRWAGAGAALAIVGTAVWILGWRTPPGTLTERLPWVYAVVALAGLGLEALHAGRRSEWLTASMLWALALASLATQALPLMIGLWALGTAVIRPCCGNTRPAPMRPRSSSWPAWAWPRSRWHPARRCSSS